MMRPQQFQHLSKTSSGVIQEDSLAAEVNPEASMHEGATPDGTSATVAAVDPCAPAWQYGGAAGSTVAGDAGPASMHDDDNEGMPDAASATAAALGIGICAQQSGAAARAVVRGAAEASMHKHSLPDEASATAAALDAGASARQSGAASSALLGDTVDDSDDDMGQDEGANSPSRAVSGMSGISCIDLVSTSDSRDEEIEESDLIPDSDAEA